MIILAESYSDAWNYCKEHKFDSKLVILIYDIKDMDRVYGYQVTSLITTDKFWSRKPADCREMFNIALSRMRFK